MNRRSLLLALPLLSLSLATLAQTQSDNILTLYVPYPPGGPSDVFARALTPGLGRQLHRTIIVENLAGASGSIAASKLLSRGNTADAVLFGSPTELVMAPAILKAVKYQPSDFRLVSLISKPPLGVYVRADLPANSIDELVAYAKANKDKPLNYGSVGIGSVYHLAGDALVRAVGVNMTHVPYRGATPLLQDLMGGQLDLAFFPVDGNLAKMTTGGKMRVIGIAGPTRSPLFPNAGTFAESSTLPKFTTVDVWGGIFTSKATSDSAVQVLHRAVQAAMTEPETRKAMELAAGVPLMPPMTLDQLANFYSVEITRYQEAAKRANLEAN
ncbi:tripartite tricarboxylate transporter substrate binding protein [Acidovorax sp. Leaf84]|uniref:tripartite tricarboxylate transporter substrate binding protein n=1 Tax=Acidovorax sp. Leaf84 TaxID=1736240 RepID=UPI000A8B5DBD|nr:tripartite tricarboxylate transporter substrate binding protein [Acidovorax sp. Leaf84]